ncbi:hypothetical protein BU23DRAFT_544960 [Bimuria novae-zelandiae CBS 107.79]|uniref:ER-golgi trafficking TRAPP I complex 85 kDa subunit-domain-containing protein n=1 Tax=Bimuria novae-zelandiae CBS 107.79 TaxID=1447943 RepID=A0A6A5UQ50_9PLEO|nr:hypothetical protein BU23DRAFT_544960 [Bimuria novae-zelandiae CBS 107.79]
MKPMQDATPKPPKYPADLETSLILPKQRGSPASSLASLPYRTSNPSLHKLFESTASISTSRPSSGSATPTASVIHGSVFSPGSRQNGTGTPRALPPGVSDEHRTLIQQAFAPHVLVVADNETEELIRGKGLEGGLLQLLRPFGESVPGKVTIRDSVGASKIYEDFGVRFVGMNETNPPRKTGGDIAQIEELVDRHLQYSEFNAQGSLVPDYLNQGEPVAQESGKSPFYTLYMRRLLSGQPMVPHETFAHPVVGVIATSSRSADPVEQLRELYNRQHQGDLRSPEWVDGQFLRYYVFIHEEETGDIAKSTTTFDSMKRHFGLNCHLLRLKGQQCISSDDEAVRLPTCEWMSASEELAEIQKRETADDITDPTPYIPESDVTAIKTFVRELVAQSMVPHMERNIQQWNEQVLARRRGLSGRFMSLSKRWTAFGSSRTSSASAISSSNSNYDPRGFYRPDAPEALMRRLADYCFMLRDTKLALSTYEILTTDFNNDKAWQHYAGAAEMAAFSALLSPALLSPALLTPKVRTEKIDEWIKAATYSYTDRQRSATPFYALRTLVLALELLRLRGTAATDDAARWASRILEMHLVGPVGVALFTERISACFALRPGLGAFHLGSRRRKAAFWAVLAAQAWWEQSKALQAEKCLDTALHLYSTRAHGSEGSEDAPPRLPLDEMQTFVYELRTQILGLRLTNAGLGDGRDDPEGDDEHGDEATETLDASPRAHRKSLVGAVAPNIDVGPLSPALERTLEKDDLFEGAV